MSIRVSEGPLPGQATLHVNASLDLTSAADLRAAVEALVNDGVKHVTVDLTGADVVDSTGLGALISALKSVRKNGGDLRLVGPNRRVRMLLELAKLTDLLKIADPPDTPPG